MEQITLENYDRVMIENHAAELRAQAMKDGIRWIVSTLRSLLAGVHVQLNRRRMQGEGSPT